MSSNNPLMQQQPQQLQQNQSNINMQQIYPSNIMTKSTFKVEAHVEEAYLALEKNNVDKLKQILMFNPNLVSFERLENNYLIQHCIRMNNALALQVVLDMMNKVKNNISIQNNNGLKITEMLYLSIDYSSHSIFIYLIQRFNLSHKDFVEAYNIDAIFDHGNPQMIEFLLNHTDFKYKINKTFLLECDNNSLNTNEGNKEIVYNSNDYVYFNCENEADKKEAYNLTGEDIQGNKILRDIFFKLGYFKILNFLTIKYKGLYGFHYNENLNEEFTPERQIRIMKYLK